MDDEKTEESIDQNEIKEEDIPLPQELVTEREGAAGEEEHKSIYQQILTMSISQKIQLALKGNKEARSILIKEPNKLICSAVVKSPKITESEISSYAKSRSVSDEVLRLISMNKDWMRSHEIVLGLANNPRTPIGISMRLLTRLSDSEVEGISKSKGVPAALSSAARRMVAQKKTKGQKH